MTTVMKRYTKGVVLKGETTDVTENAEGSLFQNSSELRLKAYIEGAVRQIVTNTQSQVLTNKTIDADNNSVSNIQTSNLKSGVLNTSTTLSGASNTQLPSALAVKTYIDDKAAAQNEASEISFVPVGTIAATNVQAMGQELDGDIQNHITNVSGAHAASAISNIPSGNLAATTVQAALNELQGDVDTRATSSDLTNHTTASANVHGIGVGNSVVGTGTSQALTNKTIDADLNTISNIDNADIKANAGIDATKIADGSVSNAEFQTLDGVTSAIQTQLNSKVNASGGTLTNGSIVTPVRSDVKQDTKANLTTYALTATNGQLAFATDTKEMFQVVDAALVPVGSGGAEGDVDSLLVQNFETAALTDFTQTGLALTTTNPIRGEISARLVHQPAVNQSFKQTIPVDRKFRGIPMTVALSARSTAAAGDLIIQFRDETNNINLQESQQIIATSTIQTFQFGVTIPANCASFSYTITALPEAGSPESVIDDIVIRNYWMGTANLGQTEYQFEVPVVTAWQDYTPTFQGFGTPVNIEFEWRQVGENVEIRGKFVSGTPTAVEARIGLPNSLTSAGTSLIPSLQIAGQAGRSSNGSTEYPVVLIEPSVNYVTIGISNGTQSPLTKTLGSGIVGAGQAYSITASIPVAGLTATTTKKVISTDLVPAKALSGNASISVPNVTGWQGYIPTFQGFGTPTNIEFEWRQVGEDVQIRGKFVTGATTAVEARIGLPGGLTSAGTALIPSIQAIGSLYRGDSAAASFSVLIEPSVTHLTFGLQGAASGGTVKQNASTMYNSGQPLSFFASVPCAGLTATKTETIGLAQSLLVQEADSSLRIVGFTPSSGATNTRIVSILSGQTIAESIGSDIIYADSAALGASFTVNTAGIYHFSFSSDANTTSAIGVGFSLNVSGAELTTGYTALPVAKKLVAGYDTGPGNVLNVSGSFNLKVGDVVRIHSSDPLNANGSWSSFAVVKQGSLKQLNPNPNSKITIPTSELRMEGASTRGSTATAIVRFDNIAKIRGDAFTVESDATLGTRITMRKKGKLNVTTNLLNSAAQTFQITLNQQTLTTISATASEIMSNVSAASGIFVTLSASPDVNVGDVIRVSGNAAPTSNISNNLSVTFQEQDISVSVTNTLPQFSESDSSVRVDTANGYGSTGTRIRRFSNVRDNIGNDIEYVPSAVNGDSFVVKSAGIYHISYGDNFSAAANMGISKNASSLTANINALAAAERITGSVASSIAGFGDVVAASPYLNVGDVIRAHTDSTTNGGNTAYFTISKVGKPNVTGVDVTPFVNIPRDDRQHFDASLNSSLNLGSIRRNTDRGIIRVENSPTANRIRITALKKASIFFSAYELRTGSTAGTIIVLLNSSGTVLQQGTAYFDATNGPGGGFVTSEILVDSGDFIEISRSGAADGTFSSSNLQVVATAASDSIITANESFSTDTANLVYAPSSLYTLATLSSAPVGTFITFTVAANTNTRTQTTTAPTQTTADMNVNGIRLFSRAYNAASTAASPAVIAIQIGKGLKGVSQNLYKSTGKATSGSLDVWLQSTFEFGARFKEYNELTGVLIVDAAHRTSTGTTAVFEFSDLTQQSDGYLVINASKSPALTGVPLLQPRIATLSDVKASGTAGGTATSGAYQTRTLNTIVDPTGVVTSLASNQFVLPAGEYYIEASAPGAYVDSHKVRLRNITDSTDSIIGVSEVTGTSGGTGIQLVANRAFLVGQLVLSSPKTFELQHRVQSTRATTGFGVAASFGDSEVYAQVKITKVK